MKVSSLTSFGILRDSGAVFDEALEAVSGVRPGGGGSVGDVLRPASVQHSLSDPEEMEIVTETSSAFKSSRASIFLTSVDFVGGTAFERLGRLSAPFSVSGVRNSTSAPPGRSFCQATKKLKLPALSKRSPLVVDEAMTGGRSGGSPFSMELRPQVVTPSLFCS